MNDPADSCRASCSLSPAQLQTRLTVITTILNQNPHKQTATNRGRCLTFHASPQLEDQLRHLVALEQECCPFLELAIEQRDQTLILTVSGDNTAQDQIDELLGPLNPPKHA